MAIYIVAVAASFWYKPSKSFGVDIYLWWDLHLVTVAHYSFQDLSYLNVYKYFQKSCREYHKVKVLVSFKYATYIIAEDWIKKSRSDDKCFKWQSG